MGPDRFTCFRRLPTELRLKIWRFALSRSAVWAPVYDAIQHTFTASTGEEICIRVVGPRYLSPTPCLAGYSCREARMVLKETNVYISNDPIEVADRHIEAPTTLHRRGGWVNPEQTVLHLGHLELIPNYFQKEQLSKFEHVVMHVQNLRWKNTIGTIATFFPRLRSISILHAEYFPPLAVVNEGHDSVVFTTEFATKCIYASDPVEL